MDAVMNSSAASSLPEAPPSSAPATVLAPAAAAAGPVVLPAARPAALLRVGPLPGPLARLRVAAAVALPGLVVLVAALPALPALPLALPAVLRPVPLTLALALPAVLVRGGVAVVVVLAGGMLEVAVALVHRRVHQRGGARGVHVGVGLVDELRHVLAVGQARGPPGGGPGGLRAGRAGRGGGLFTRVKPPGDQDGRDDRHPAPHRKRAELVGEDVLVLGGLSRGGGGGRLVAHRSILSSTLKSTISARTNT